MRAPIGAWIATDDLIMRNVRLTILKHQSLQFAVAGLVAVAGGMASCAAPRDETSTGVPRRGASLAAEHREAFERLKALEGDYVVGSPSEPSVTVAYRCVSRGTALLEEWAWPGGARELTVFFMDNDTLRATHYCHSGIQSTMALQESPAGQALVFRIASATNLPSPDVAHNTGFRYVMEVDGTVRRSEAWTEDGKVTMSEVRLVPRASTDEAARDR